MHSVVKVNSFTLAALVNTFQKLSPLRVVISQQKAICDILSCQDNR